MITTSPPIAKQKVLIVEDSLVVRTFLETIVNEDDRLSLQASVSSAEEALSIIAKSKPNVISMDIHLPGMNGIEATQKIMEESPTPIVVISASIDSKDLDSSMEALKAGALNVLEKPSGLNESHARQIAKQLYLMSQVKVIKKRRLLTDKTFRQAQAHQSVEQLPSKCAYRMLGIASSTGGPQALVKLLGELGANFPLPILLVQHMTDSFLDGFVDWLNDCCPQKVVRASHGQTPKSNHVYVAPPEAHMLYKFGAIYLQKSEPVCSQLPSADLLLQSMATSIGRAGIGIVLTGMGEDGADGLKAMRDTGAWTLAESSETAVVYGMPRAAVERGAAIDQLPLGKIASKVLQLVD